MRESLNLILQKHTGQPLERLERDTDRDFIMTAAQACDYGLVDHVIDKRP
jgi:ATP-dependent Clp protease protease subunit